MSVRIAVTTYLAGTSLRNLSIRMRQWVCQFIVA